MEMLALTGNTVEGDILTAVEVIPNSETQHVWSKYKKDIRYQWYEDIHYTDAACSDIFLNFVFDRQK